MRVAPSEETREVARAAAQWLALLESGGASDEDHARLQHWRSSDSRHENAWQKIQQLRQRFAGLPPALAMATLDRPDPARRAALKRALGVAALVPAAWLIGRELPLEVWRADLHTSTGERRTVQLAQDSSLQLNTDSAVNVDLPARQLTLIRGEMALNVAGDSAFIVNAPYGADDRQTQRRLGSPQCTRLPSLRAARLGAVAAGAWPCVCIETGPTSQPASLRRRGGDGFRCVDARLARRRADGAKPALG
jgi:hypothetical protein